jgi:hypothetical protein
MIDFSDSKYHIWRTDEAKYEVGLVSEHFEEQDEAEARARQLSQETGIQHSVILAGCTYERIQLPAKSRLAIKRKARLAAQQEGE